MPPSDAKRQGSNVSSRSIEDRGHVSRHLSDDRSPASVVETLPRDRTSRDRTSRDRTSRDRNASDRTANERTAGDRAAGERTAADRTTGLRTASDRIERGRISFVGAGPGAADLLTARAIRVLNEADVVLHDAIGCQEALVHCPQARRIAVGKRAGGPATEQRFINRRMIAEAGHGHRVVRLKGGDPTIFGRLDEEIRALAAAGLAYDIVPGITAATAAAAAAGVSLTRRGLARSLVIGTPATGRGERGNPGWARAAGNGSTVAVYMSGRILPQTARELIAAGFDQQTPALIARAVSTDGETLHSTTLSRLAAANARSGESPVADACVLLVGESLRHRANPVVTEFLARSRIALGC